MSKLRHESERRVQVDEQILAMVSMREDASTSFPFYSLPPPPAYFFGRENELRTIRDHLRLEDETHELRTFVVSGLGGVGKTALALAFADCCKTDRALDAILWISSDSPAEVRRSFSEIALRLELPRASRESNDESNIMIVRNWLGKTSS